MSHDTEFDVAVIGAGISGIVTAKCLLDDKFKIIVYEKTGHIGGLWQFTGDGYGVMSFTHMYVQSSIVQRIKMAEVELGYSSPPTPSFQIDKPLPLY